MKKLYSFDTAFPWYRLYLVPVFLLVCFSASACTEYWWTRGQAPSVDTLLSRSQNKLQMAVSVNSAKRAVMANRAIALKASLLAALADLKAGSGNHQAVRSLAKARADFLGLEEFLSVTSLAPYGELSGQMRSFFDKAANGSNIDYPAFGLFTARTIFFLARELELSV